jgi:hypothetical protein
LAASCWRIARQFVVDDDRGRNGNIAGSEGIQGNLGQETAFNIILTSTILVFAILAAVPALQPGRDVDAMAVNLFAVYDYIAEIDPNAKFHPALRWNPHILSLEHALDLDGALDRVDYAGELR